MTKTIENMNFDTALAELEQIVRQLEDGKIKLEDAVTVYERGITLKRLCETKLKDAQMKIEQIHLNADGTIGAAAFDQAN